MIYDPRIAFINYWTIIEILLDKKVGRGLLDQNDLKAIRGVLSKKYEVEIDRIMSQIANIDKMSKIDRMTNEIGKYLDNTVESKSKLIKFNRLRGKLVHFKDDSNDGSISKHLIEIKEFTNSLITRAIPQANYSAYRTT